MRIMYVCNEYPPVSHGGIGIFVKTISELLVKNGLQVMVTGYHPTSKKEIVTSIKGVKVNLIPRKVYYKTKISKYNISYEPIGTRIRLSKHVEKLIKVFEPDLIESYDWSGPLWKKPTVPLIIRLHGANTAHQFFQKRKLGFLTSFFEKRNIAMSDAICSVSKHIGELTFQSFKMENKIYKCIYNFTDTSRFQPLKNINRDTNTILYVGGIKPRKGIDELFELMEIAMKEKKDIKLKLVGPYKNEYKQSLLNNISKDLHSRIYFSGYCDHDSLPSVYSKAHLLIMPSKAEAFGLTAIEAMACGTPVFMEKGSSGPEIINDNIDGWLFDVYSAKKSAHKLLEVLSLEKSGMDKMRENAIQKVNSFFSSEIAISNNIDFYKDVIKLSN